MFSAEVKQRIIKLAIAEGQLKLEGNELKGGKEIEKYLAIFRKLFIKHNSLYLNPQQGFQWCCAYVYYILTQAGCDIAISPIKNSTMHLGSVEAWVIYAKQQNILRNSWQGIEIGDVIIFDQLMGEPLDHVGIVVEVHDNYLLCSEGNFYNKSGLFKKNKDSTIWGYIRL